MDHADHALAGFCALYWDNEGDLYAGDGLSPRPALIDFLFDWLPSRSDSYLVRPS
jgi:hypothetical protein